MKKIFLLLVFPLVYCCKTAPVSVQNYNKAMISFGSGGGFTGARSEYILLDNGFLYENSKMSTVPVEINHLDSKMTTQIFNNIHLLGLDTMKYNKPQNLYYFLKYKNGNDSNYICWGGKPQGRLESAAAVYRQLQSQLKNLKK
ncbi:MAG TPA: hypothetical protein PK076_13415 [Saprospiraceae bacterium]|nr:hypothetical protein [Saprospiraceae bacterium]HQW57126.1 hypothetical protein [Saprospiraceae bacterium]